MAITKPLARSPIKKHWDPPPAKVTKRKKPMAYETWHKETPKEEHKKEVKEDPKKEVSTKDAPGQLAAITPGTAILGTATIDSLFTLIYGTRANTQGSIAYSWNTPDSIIGQYTDGSAVFARFEARPYLPTTITK